MSHKTTNIIIKSAEVDNGIVPVVGWLNSFSSVVTRHSCQGDPTKKNGKPQALPYVQFTCDDQIELATILRVFGTAGTVHVCLNDMNYGSSLMYVLGFTSTETLKWVIERLPFQYKESQ